MFEPRRRDYASMLGGLHVVLVAYGVDPLRGSEPGNAWAWLNGVSRHVHRISLVTSPESASVLRRSGTQQAGVPTNVNVIEVRNDGMALCKTFPDWYRQYGSWLDAAADVVGQIEADVAHHLNVGSPFWGSSLHRFQGPRVLGPVGISNRPPLGLLPRFGARGMVEELVRAQLSAHPKMWSRGLAGVLGADHVLASDPHTAGLADSVGTQWTAELIEGVEGIREECRQEPDPILMWAGKMVDRKGPLLAVQAWRRARLAMPGNATLVIMGDGPQRREIEREVRRAGLGGSVHSVGAVSRQEVVARLETARGLLFTSLRDTSSSQILEAMSVGTPAVSLRHRGVQGLDTWYPRILGWSAAAGTWRGAVAALSAEMVACIGSPRDVWTHKSDSSRAAARQHMWTTKVERALQTYGHLLESRG